MENSVLSEKILEFIEKYAIINPNYDALYDDFEDRFTSPDASELYNAGILLKDNIIPKQCNSSFGGCGYIYKQEVREQHDFLVKEVYKKING